MNHSLKLARGFPLSPEDSEKRAWFSLLEEERAWILQASPDSVLIWHARLFTKDTRTPRENRMLDGLRYFLLLGAEIMQRRIKSGRHT